MIMSHTGLHLTVDIHQDQYLTELGKSAGVRVLINNQQQMPFPEEDGLHASPGFLTAIGIKKVNVPDLNSLCCQCYQLLSNEF